MNFFRQVRRCYHEMLRVIPEVEGPAESRTAIADVMRTQLEVGLRSQKFTLPDGGIIVEDLELRALVASPIRLPFPSILLEFSRPPLENVLSLDELGHPMSSSRTCVFAWEEGFDSGDPRIFVSVSCLIDEIAGWMPLGTCAIPAARPFLELEGKRTIHVLRQSRVSETEVHFVSELTALLMFLNALACSNVETERIEARKVRKKARDPIPFDVYHRLTIRSGSAARAEPTAARFSERRGPREHLRRGHIRRLAADRFVWVNAAVVGSAERGGRVFKTYSIERGGTE